MVLHLASFSTPETVEPLGSREQADLLGQWDGFDSTCDLTKIVVYQL